jgi:hypothetical protein
MKLGPEAERARIALEVLEELEQAVVRGTR